MNPPTKTPSTPGKEKSTAELQSEHAANPAHQQAHTAKQSGGDQGAGSSKQYDWREQSEPHAIEYPPRMPVADQQDEKPPTKVSEAQPAPRAALPGAPYVAGTAITITPYTAAGRPTIYVMGNEQLGSEYALQLSIRNQVHLPALKV